MCFSTEVSFSAAVLLGAIGSATLKASQYRSQFFLAAIPLLFSIQQLSEGLLWLNLEQHLFSATFSKVTQSLFLFFAFIIWPIWIPLSVAVVEKVQWRCNLLYLNLFCGALLSILNLAYAIGHPDISVRIVYHSLQYIGHAPSQTLAYPLIVLLPSFISSLKNMWMFGCIVALTYVVAYYYYSSTFVSVWCFFAALASLGLYKILQDNQVYFKKTKFS